MKLCDLHTHSDCSDGSLSPSRLAEAAARCGLSAVALTDHNTVRGLREFTDAGVNAQILSVPGCEFTTQYGRTELHIIGLFLPEDKWEQIDAVFTKMRESKREMNDRMLALLQADGYAVTRAEAEALTEAEFNRSHVARVLCKKGYVRDVKEAFATLLQEGGKYYTPSERLDTLDTIRFIRSVGAVPVLAHSFLNMNERELRAFLPQAVDAGLCAMETRYSAFDAQTTRAAEAIAAEFGLLQSGGSDFHGDAKPDVHLGSGKGSLCVPFSYYERLADLAATLYDA